MFRIIKLVCFKWSHEYTENVRNLEQILEDNWGPNLTLDSMLENESEWLDVNLWKLLNKLMKVMNSFGLCLYYRNQWYRKLD
jgi:hypothetical protein